MVIGKTYSSISKTEVFSKFSETQVLSTVFPEITTIPCVICSPLREDNKPSFSIYMSSNGHIHYKDLATRDSGGLLDLLCSYWKCNFNSALDNICMLMVNDTNVTIKPKQIKVFTQKELNTLSKIQVTIRPWRDYDYEYWASYGITKSTLGMPRYTLSHIRLLLKKT